MRSLTSIYSEASIASRTSFLLCSSIASVAVYRQVRSWLQGDFRNAKGERIPCLSLVAFLRTLVKRVFKEKSLNPASVLELQQQFGEIWQTPMSTMITSPELVKYVISSNWPKVQLGTMKKSVLFSRLLGHSLVSVDGDEWRTQRKIMSPAFHHTQLAQLFAGIFRDTAATLVQRWLLLCNTGPTRIDAHDWMCRLTVDVIGRAAFSHDFKALSREIDKVDPWLNALEEGLRLVANPFLFFLPWTQHLPIRRNRIMNSHLAKLDELVFQILQEKRQKRYANSSPDLLDLILREQEEGQKITDRALHNNVFLFFLAGHETSASTLSFALYLLGKHPEAQQKAREEAMVALAEHGDESIPLEALDKLLYITAVLKETLRMFPPAAAITPRVCPAGNETLSGYRIPKGAVIGISIYALHYNPSHWPEPNTFIPERFLGKTKHHPFAWMPFSAGPRACIGTNFAWLEMRAVLALILRSFVWEVPPDYELKLDRYITLRPQKGLPLIIKPVAKTT